MKITTKPLTFVPPKHGRGKWHAVSCGASCLPVCGRPVELDPQSSVREVIAGGTGVETVHPIYCQKCLRAALPIQVRLVKTAYGYSTPERRFAVVRCQVWGFRGTRGAGRYFDQFQVHEGSPSGPKVGGSCDTLRQAREVIVRLYEGSVE